MRGSITTRRSVRTMRCERWRSRRVTVLAAGLLIAGWTTAPSVEATTPAFLTRAGASGASPTARVEPESGTVQPLTTGLNGNTALACFADDDGNQFCGFMTPGGKTLFVHDDEGEPVAP